jgi:mitochondrial fission protein ELM1
VLTDAGSERAAEALALAEALGWPFEKKSASLEALEKASPARSVDLASPRPDVVISAGRKSARLAQDIREREQGRVRLIHVGEDGGEVADLFDAVVTPSWSGLWPHPHRIETLTTLARDTNHQGRAEGTRADSVPNRKSPRILLVSSSRAEKNASPDVVRRMERDVQHFAEQSGGSSCAVRVDDERPLNGLIANADVLVVPGNDAKLVSKVVAASRPVYVYPLTTARTSATLRLRQWVERHALAQPDNRRGTPRPQQGLEYLCARLIERGIVRPPCDLNLMHQELYRSGAALPFGAPLRIEPHQPIREIEQVAANVRSRIGLGA